MANTRGRQLVIALTNKSGGAVAAGDVVVIDTSNNDAFTTTTTGRAEVSIGIAQETIASNAVGRVLVGGYAPLVNVPASVTRGHFIETHTVVKQATGNSTRRSGSFGQFGTGGTTPTAWLWGQTDQTAGGAGGITQSYLGYNTAGGTIEAMSNGRVYFKAITPASNGLLAAVEAYVKGNASNVAPLVFGLYADNAGAPGTLLSPRALPQDSLALFLNSTPRWIGAPMGTWLTSGTTYWMGVGNSNSASSTPFSLYYDAAGTDQFHTTGGWLADGDRYALTTGTRKYSIRGVFLV